MFLLPLPPNYSSVLCSCESGTTGLHWFLSSDSLSLYVVLLSMRSVSLKLMNPGGGRMHGIVPKAGRCRGGGRGHESHCNYSAQGSGINAADVNCINISCWNVILMFLLCASGWLDCLTFKNSYLLQLSSLQAAGWVEYMGGCILFAFQMEYFILMDKIIHENNL